MLAIGGAASPGNITPIGAVTLGLVTLGRPSQCGIEQATWQ